MSVIALLASTLFGCEKPGQIRTGTGHEASSLTTEVQERKPESEVKTTESIDTDSSRVNVELISPGEGEMRKLRYVFHEGREHIRVLGMQSNTKLQPKGRKLAHVVQPKVLTALKITESAPESDGSSMLELEIDQMGLKPTKETNSPYFRKGTASSQLRLAGAAKAWVKLSTTGIVEQSEYMMPPGASLQLQNLLTHVLSTFKNLPIQLPEQPIAPGAKWTIRRPVQLGPMAAEQTAFCTLRSVKGTIASILCKLKQHAESQDVHTLDEHDARVDGYSLEGNFVWAMRINAFDFEGGGSSTSNLESVVENRGVKQRTSVTDHLTFAVIKKPDPVTR